jgi:hypothetical protein
VLRPSRIHRLKNRSPEFSGFLNQPFETFELDQGGEYCDVHRRGSRRQLFEYPEADGRFARAVYLGKKHVAIVREFENLSGFDSQNPHKMLGVCACQLSGTASHFRYEKPPASHHALT